MLYPDLTDVPIEVFGGYVSSIAPSDLPPGAAALAQDVQFPLAGLRTRGGLMDYFGPNNPGIIPANASINGVKSYITPTLAQRLLAWDSVGNFYKESPQGTITLIGSRPYANLFYQSQTYFGREYQAFFNNLGGFDIPRQFDDTNWDRVSQQGPGVSPIVTNFAAPSVGIGPTLSGTVNIANSPSGIVFGGLTTIYLGRGHYLTYYTFFTVQTTTAHGLTAGQQVTISGSTSTPQVNGTFTVLSVLTAQTFTVAYTTFPPITDGGGGVVGAAVAGVSMIRQNNTVTANTTTAHGFQPGWQVQISAVSDTNLGGAITNVVRSNAGIVTITTTNPHGFVPNSIVNITGVSNPDGTFNGQFTVATVPSPTTFTYQQAGTAESGTGGGNAQDVWNGFFVILEVPTPDSFTYTNVGPNDSTTGTGTAAIIGQVMPGLHGIAVSFITRQGFITEPSVPAYFNAGGGQQLLSCNQIPLGPANVVARLLMFTAVITPPATTGEFFSITSTMMIADNVTTTAIVDFNEEVLISGFSADYLFTQLELGESAFVLGYNSRLCWLGERAKVTNFINGTLDFDGGFMVIDNVGTQAPNGWTLGTDYAGGGEAFVQPPNPPIVGDWQAAFYIVADGVSQIRGQIQQSAFQDYLGVSILQNNVSYSVRIRAMIAQGTPAILTTGNIHVYLQSTSQSLVTAGLSVSAAQMSGEFQEFTGTLTAPIAQVPSDLLLFVQMDGTAGPSGGTIVVDSIEVFPTNTPFNYSTARLSHAFNPESYDGSTGQIQVRPGDGQQLRAGFPMRNSLYLAKDHYLCYVEDDGVNEPSAWNVNEVSATVGICGPNAVDWTEEWAAFAERSGLYLCWGSDPVQITPEIQTDGANQGRICWESINWQYGHTIWVRIWRSRKMILVGAPVNGATSPNIVFMLDYRWLDTAADIAASPLVTYSAFTGKALAHGRGRRWALWNITANSMTFAERSDGTAQPFYGNGSGNGIIYQQADNFTSDNGIPILSTWQSYGAPSHIEEQQYQLSAHRKLCGYLKFRAVGNGTLNLSVGTALRTTLLRGYSLSLSPPADGERPVNVQGERFYITVGTSVAGSWFQLEQLIPCMKKSATIPVRGLSV